MCAVYELVLATGELPERWRGNTARPGVRQAARAFETYLSALKEDRPDQPALFAVRPPRAEQTAPEITLGKCKDNTRGERGRMLTWEQIERSLRAAGCGGQSIEAHRRAHLKRCRRVAVEARRRRREEEYEQYRRANLLDYFEGVEEERAARLGV